MRHTTAVRGDYARFPTSKLVYFPTTGRDAINESSPLLDPDLPDLSALLQDLSFERNGYEIRVASGSDCLKRRAAKLKVRALSSEARMSAYLLGGLPFFMFGLLYFINPDYISVLITDFRGNIMLGAAVIWMFIGFAVMKRMITFEI